MTCLLYFIDLFKIVTELTHCMRSVTGSKRFYTIRSVSKAKLLQIHNSCLMWICGSS